jgi:hypothetical protein
MKLTGRTGRGNLPRKRLSHPKPPNPARALPNNGKAAQSSGDNKTARGGLVCLSVDLGSRGVRLAMAKG